MSTISRVRALTSSLLTKQVSGGSPKLHIPQCGEAPFPHGKPLPSHLVEESLAEVLHSALELIPLGLPLLIVAHILGCGALPGGSPSIVIHVVKPASGVCAFLPAGNIKLSMNRVTTPPLPSNSSKLSRQLARRDKEGPREGEVWCLAQGLARSQDAQPARPQSQRLLGLR